MGKCDYDVIIVGGGASGLMASVGIATNNKNVKILIIEKNEKIGKKIYITGKGRCNVTNNSDSQNIIENIVHNSKFLYSAINKCNPTFVMNFFESNGCKLKTERGNRVFPVSEKASDVIKVFNQFIVKNNINLRLKCTVVGVIYDDDIYIIKLNTGEVISCKFLVIATGGMSYPLTGSTGDGYKFAKIFGHSIAKLKPALCGFKCANIDELNLLTLKNIELKVVSNNKLLFKKFGDITFYKNLISGPLCLTASSMLNDYSSFKLVVDLKPNVSDNEFKERYYKVYNENINNSVLDFLSNFMPFKMCEYIIKLQKIEKYDKVKTIPNDAIKAFLSKIKALEFDNVKLDDIEKGIVTAGGVSVKEINPNSMESKLNKNLFFVGEVLDLDAFTGGYNMQIAFTTGYVCGQYIASQISNE